MIIWECILNKHPARISIVRHNETLYTVRTPKWGHFICETKKIRHFKGLTYRTRSKLHPALRIDAAGLDVGRVWLFSQGQTVLPTKGIYRRLQLCYAIDLHFMCLSEPRNKCTEVEHEDSWPTGRPWPCPRFQN